MQCLAIYGLLSLPYHTRWTYQNQDINRMRARKKQFLPTPFLLFSFITLCNAFHCFLIQSGPLLLKKKSLYKNREIPVVSTGCRFLKVCYIHFRLHYRDLIIFN